MNVEKLIREKIYEYKAIDDRPTVYICTYFGDTLNMIDFSDCYYIYLDYDAIDCWIEDGEYYVEITNDNYHDFIRRLNDNN